MGAGTRVGWAAFAGYVGFNLLRKSWPSAVAQPSFAAALTIDTPAIGAINSLHGAAYGASKLGGSLLCDHLPSRHTAHVFSLGLGTRSTCGSLEGLDGRGGRGSVCRAGRG